MCGCGKAYLSYPALYTHVKNKHDGIFPIGSNAKRKIPKNVEEDCDHLFIPNLERFYQDFEDFINQIDGAAADERKTPNEFDITRLFESIDDGTDKEIQSFKASMKLMLQIQSDVEKFDQVKDSLSISQILSYFLLSIYPFCNYQFFKEYFYLIFMALKALNDKGELFVDKSEKPNSKHDEKLFTESSEIHVSAEILNLFIAELFPNLLRNLKETKNLEFKYLGFEDEHIKNLILMSKYLANWLFNHELTEYRLEINVDF